MIHALVMLSLIAPAQEGEPAGETRIAQEGAWESDKIINRLGALEALLSGGDTAYRLEMLRYVAAVLDTPESSGGERVNAERRAQGIQILEYFLGNCARYFETPEEKRALQSMVLRVCRSKESLLPGEVYGLAYQRLMELAATRAERNAYALSFIQEESNKVGWRAVGIFKKAEPDSETLEKLRSIALETLERGHANALALDVLGHYGDAVILDVLKDYREQSEDAESSRVIDKAVAQIEIQHPRERLLELLRSGEADLGARWIVERASQLFPVDEVRAAVLLYYDRAPKERLDKARIWGLDRAVVEAGVLSESELPGKPFGPE